MANARFIKVAKEKMKYSKIYIMTILLVTNITNTLLSNLPTDQDYLTLQLNPQKNYSVEDIKKAYKELIKQKPSNELLKQVNSAKQTIIDYLESKKDNKVKDPLAEAKEFIANISIATKMREIFESLAYKNLDDINDNDTWNQFYNALSTIILPKKSILKPDETAQERYDSMPKEQREYIKNYFLTEVQARKKDKENTQKNNPANNNQTPNNADTFAQNQLTNEQIQSINTQIYQAFENYQNNVGSHKLFKTIKKIDELNALMQQINVQININAFIQSNKLDALISFTNLLIRSYNNMYYENPTNLQHVTMQAIAFCNQTNVALKDFSLYELQQILPQGYEFSDLKGLCKSVIQQIKEYLKKNDDLINAFKLTLIL